MNFDPPQDCTDVRLILDELKSVDVISADQVRAWMQSESMLERAIAYDILRPYFPYKVVPEMTPDEVVEFLLREISIILGSATNVVTGGDSAYCEDVAMPIDAAQDAMTLYWYAQLDDWGPKDRFKEWFTDFYLKSDDKMRNVLVTFILEHMFEKQSARDHFAGWKDHPELLKGYTEACEWFDLIGRKPE